jgi:hypothetical protein
MAMESSPLVHGGFDWWLLLMYLVATVNVFGGHGAPLTQRLPAVIPGGYGDLPPAAWRLRLVASAYVPGGYC